MKKTILFYTIIFTTLIGCNQREGEHKTGLLSYLVNISDTEDAGVKDVLGFYGGYCEYSIGTTVSSEASDKKYFELKLSQSEGADRYKEAPRYPASNIAYRFYRNLSAEEKQKYTHINPVLVFSDGSEREFEYSTWELGVVEKRMKFLDKVVNIIREKRFEDLKPMLNDSTMASYDKNELIDNLIKADPRFGNVTAEGFRIFGYRIDALDSKGNDYLYISGAIMRDKQANEFSMVVDPYTDKEEIFILQYEM